MINVAQLVGATITAIYLDSLGRRKLAIWGGVAMGIPHAILAGLVATYSTTWAQNPAPAWFSVALVYVYVLMFGLTYGPLGWTLPAEVYPNAIRAKGVGLAVAVNWAANTCIVSLTHGLRISCSKLMLTPYLLGLCCPANDRRHRLWHLRLFCRVLFPRSDLFVFLRPRNVQPYP
jgi:MFS family permease